MTALQVLQKYGWIQGDFGDKEHGFCAVGAIDQAYHGGNKYAKAHKRLVDYITKRYHTSRVIAWNDKRVRTKRQVLAAFKAAKV